MENTMTNATAPVENTQLAKADGGQMIVPTGNPIMDMAQRAAESGDIDMVKELLAIRDEENKAQAERAFNAAYAAAQSEFPIIPKRGKAHNNIAYARIEDIMQAVMPVLAKHGLSLRHKTDNENGVIQVTAILAHVDGHSERDTIFAEADKTGSKNSIQAIKSSITYMRRTTTENVLGLSSHGEDDDAFAAAESDAMIELRTRIGKAKDIAELDVIRAEIMTGDLTPQERTTAGHVWTAKTKTMGKANAGA